MRAALDELQILADAVAQRCEHVTLRFDLCELTGYGYHTGAVFAAYSENFGRAVARGGRYDGVGVSFGRARPATGFDVDLKRLPRSTAGARQYAPSGRRASLGTGETRATRCGARFASCAQAGERVVGALNENETPTDDCDREFVWQKNAWRVQALKRR